ncbi:hypothetical protein A4G27_08760 [Mycobacterium kansasii]|nr:hypothetical protein A4G27_08760 [Mycobacterium kansasii]
MSLRVRYFGAIFPATGSGDEFFVTEVRCAPGTAARHSLSVIAAAPERRRAATDLKRLLPYLIPYRAWIVIVVAATASLVATVGIPIMTRAVIDGPVRHHDQRGLWVLGSAAMGLGLSEATAAMRVCC